MSGLKRVADKVMSTVLEIEGVMINVGLGVGCGMEEKEDFLTELDEMKVHPRRREQ